MSKKIVIPEPKEILEKAKWNKDTSYESQLSYTMPNGFIIHVVKSSEITTRKDMEEILVERVTESYQSL